MTNNAYDDDRQPYNNNSGGVNHTKKERYYQAVREHESRDSQLNAQLELRQQGATEVRQRHFALVDARQTEYEKDRARLKQKLDDAKLDLEEAHRSASEHCSEISVRYVPGKTTEADVLSVSRMEEAAAAKRLGLPFGVGINNKLVKFLKPLLTTLSWGMSSLSLGLGFRLLDAKNIFGNPANVGYSLIIGGVVAIGILVASSVIWKPVGTKVGAGRPTKEVSGLLIPVVGITALLFFGMAFLDAKALILLNAARAALNPAFAIPMEVAMLIGVVLSGIYVIGLSGAAFMDGYNEAATKSIEAEIKGDENSKRDALKLKMPIKEALESLGNVKVAEQIIQNLEDDLKRMDQEFKRERAEMLASLPEMPTTLEGGEVEELTNLRDRARSAKAHFDAHVVTRGDGVTNNGKNG